MPRIPLTPGIRFLHARLLDPDWKPEPWGVGRYLEQRYTDAPPAECRVTAIRNGRVYYALRGETRSHAYFPLDDAANHIREILT